MARAEARTPFQSGNPLMTCRAASRSESICASGSSQGSFVRSSAFRSDFNVGINASRIGRLPSAAMSRRVRRTTSLQIGSISASSAAFCADSRSLASQSAINSLASMALTFLAQLVCGDWSRRTMICVSKSVHRLVLPSVEIRNSIPLTVPSCGTRDDV
jgi:hypothetical protein